MTKHDNLLLIFYRNPELGKVKTRLAATMGNQMALSVYLKLVAHTKNITEGLKADKLVLYSHTVEKADQWPDEVFQKANQSGGDLGERMKNAFHHGFDLGYKHICIIGTDCLELNHTIIETAFHALEQRDVVLGPAKDGGYYLLGMKKMYADFFINKNWSTQTVMHDTLLNVLQQQASLYLLPLLSDVDVEEDLKGKLL
jgi:uncharacterized protein